MDQDPEPFGQIESGSVSYFFTGPESDPFLPENQCNYRKFFLNGLIRLYPGTYFLENLENALTCSSPICHMYASN